MDRTETTALLKEAREGSAEALDDLFARYGARLLSVIRLRLGPSLRGRLESRDILQDCFLKAFERLDQFEGSERASLMGWLARIAENEIRDQAEFHGRQRRDARREVPLDDAPGGLVHRVRSVSSRVALGQQTRHLERALERLEEAHREVIVLRKLQEMSWREVGERMGRTDDASRMLFARAMAALTMEVGRDP